MGCDWNMYQNLNTEGVLDESGTDNAVFCRRKVTGSFRYLVNVRGL